MNLSSSFKALAIIASALPSAWSTQLLSGDFVERTSEGIDFQCESFQVDHDAIPDSITASGTFHYANSCANCSIDGDCSYPSDFSVCFVVIYPLNRLNSFYFIRC